MKRFSFLSMLTLVVFAASLSLNSCKKETAEVAIQSIEDGAPVSNRALVSYGVTLYDGVNPCRIVEMDNASGNVTNVAPPAFYIDNSGNVIALENLKGICLTSWGQYFLTTGNPANPTLAPTSIYNNALFKVNPVTGQCSYASTNFASGTVSDLEHNPANLKFYGLRNNSNAIIEIEDNANNYGTYNGPFAVTGIANGYTLSGLTLVRDQVGMYLVGCANTPIDADPAKLYIVPFNGGAATFLTDLAPHADFSSGGHCGLGFDREHKNLKINRTNNNGLVPLGVSDFQWTPFLGPVTMTTHWGALGFDFEDLTSSVY